MTHSRLILTTILATRSCRWQPRVVISSTLDSKILVCVAWARRSHTRPQRKPPIVTTYHVGGNRVLLKCQVAAKAWIIHAGKFLIHVDRRDSGVHAYLHCHASAGVYIESMDARAAVSGWLWNTSIMRFITTGLVSLTEKNQIRFKCAWIHYENSVKFSKPLSRLSYYFFRFFSCSAIVWTYLTRETFFCNRRLDK